MILALSLINSERTVKWKICLPDRLLIKTGSCAPEDARTFTSAKQLAPKGAGIGSGTIDGNIEE